MNAVSTKIRVIPAPVGAERANFLAYIPAIAIVCGAIVLRCVTHLCADVSWLITLGERMLGGARPYTDFIEVNPPASILLYFPAVWIGDSLNVEPETIVILFVFIASCASIALAGQLLTRAELMDARERPYFVAAALFFLLLMPAYAFAEREHFALIAILPMLCLYMVRAQNFSCRMREAIIAGSAGGVAVVIKPHFALALLLPFLYVLWRRRGERSTLWQQLLSVENLTVLFVVGVYSISVFWFFPAFVHDMMPIVTTLYVSVRAPLLHMITTPSSVFWALGSATATIIAARHAREPLCAVTLLASAGFIAAMILQGKGWPYHGYPAVTLVLLLSTLFLLRRRKDAARSAATVVALVGYIILLPLVFLWFSQSNERNGLVDAVARVAPSHPVILAISDDLAVAHPLTRLLQGRFAGTAGSQQMTSYAYYLLHKAHLNIAEKKRIEAYAALEVKLLLKDEQREKPDIILVDRLKGHDWAHKQPQLLHALKGYQLAQTVSQVEIWCRIGRIKATAAP